MRNLIITFFLVSSSAFAQMSAQEEAIILNQEMQFLEESAQNVTAVSRPLSANEDTIISDTPRSLERSYFGEEELDTVRTRTAAPKRRLVP